MPDKKKEKLKNNLLLVIEDPTEEELVELEENLAEEDDSILADKSEDEVVEAEFVSGDIVGIYLREAAKYPLLTKELEIFWAKKKDEGDRFAKDILIKSNLRLVVKVAKKYVGMGRNLLDLVQEGNIGLMKAVDRFDHTKDCRFSTYAIWWIRQNITRAISNSGRTIRLPVHRVDRVAKLKRITANYVKQKGTIPDEEYIISEMKISELVYRQIIEDMQLIIDRSLNDDLHGDGKREFGDTISNVKDLHFEFVGDQKKLRKEIYRAYKKLEPMEKHVMRLRLGKQLTVQVIAKKLNLTIDKIRRVEDRSTRKIKRMLQKTFNEVIA
jgi:RNA polymerase primary sigma factor